MDERKPDMPKLDVKIEGNQDVVVFVNGKSFATTSDNQKLENLPLEKGWNHVFITLKKQDGKRNWRTKVSLESNKKDFLDQLDSAVGRIIKHKSIEYKKE